MLAKDGDLNLIERITSRHNPRIKKAIRLRSSRGRQVQGRIIVFGQREVERAIAAGVTFQEIYFHETESESAIRKIESSIRPNRTHLLQLDDRLFEKIAYGDRPDGIVGVAERPVTRLEDIQIDDQPGGNGSLVLVVQAIEKPGNIGAIVRTADACGAIAVVCADPVTDVFHPNAIRSSTGTVFNVPIATGPSEDVQKWLRDNNFRVYTAMMEEAVDFFQADLSGNVAIVLGNEANGLDSQWRADDFIPVKLPMRGHADSLNVSVAASVMAYEAIRQRCFDR